MNPNTHIIQKLQVSLTASQRENTLHLQQRFERMLEEQLLPRLEPVFDRLAGPEAWIELGQLEVPLSRLDPQASEADWLEKTCRACIGALEQEMQKPAATKRSGSPENALAVLACFLERGHLPWWVEDYELEAAVQNIIPTQAPSILKLLRPVNAQKRWARQFGPAIQEQLLRATGKNPFLSQREWRDLFPELTAQKSSLVYWETIWEAREQPGSFTENWMRNLLLQSLHLLPADKALRKLSALHENAAPLHRLCSIAQELFPFTPAQWAKILPRQKARQVYWEAFREAKTAPVDFRQNWVDLLVRKTMLAGLGDSGWAALMETVRQSPALSGPQKDQLQAAIAGRQLPVLPASLEEGAFLPPLPIDEQGIYVSLAGIVMAHPFLPAFFGRLKLLEGEQFKDEAARERAVHLLYFLAAGRQNPAEQETVLLKLLCGMELGRPIEKEAALSETEKAEANRLLESMIQNWDALEGSCPDDLRGSFLIRAGKLQKNEMGWQLKVEQQAFDILLGQLPWGLSPVLHPWMPEMLWVEW